MGGAGGFILVLVIGVLVVVGKILQAAQEEKARAERQRKGSQGGATRTTEYAAPAQEVREFLEQVRRGQSQIAAQQRTAATPPTQTRRAARPAQESPRGDACDSDAERSAHRGAEKVREGATARIARAQASVSQATQRIVDQKKRLQAIRSSPKATRRARKLEREERAREAVELVPEPITESGLWAYLDDPADLRRAIVLSEILAPPLALRRPG